MITLMDRCRRTISKMDESEERNETPEEQDKQEAKNICRIRLGFPATEQKEKEKGDFPI